MLESLLFRSLLLPSLVVDEFNSQLLYTGLCFSCFVISNSIFWKHFLESVDCDRGGGGGGWEFKLEVSLSKFKPAENGILSNEMEHLSFSPWESSQSHLQVGIEDKVDDTEFILISLFFRHNIDMPNIVKKWACHTHFIF